MKFLNEYIASPTHRWWVDNVWRPSWTRFLAWMYGIPAMLVAAGSYISYLANDDRVAQLLEKMHTPDWVPAVIAGIALMHLLGKGHK